MVGLSFDDGPDAVATPALLELLAARRATATFFVLADRAAAQPELVTAMLAGGHEVGLHGLDHARPTALPRRHIVGWLRTGRDRLEQVTGEPVRWFRPPFGAQGLATYRAARRAGLDVAVWQTDAGDWLDGRPDEVADRAFVRLRPGGVLLLHERLDDRPDAPADGPGDPRWHVDVAREVLDGVAARGWSAASLGSMLQTRSPDRTVWFR